MRIPRWDRYPLVAHSSDAKSWLTIQANLGLAQNTIEAYGQALEDFLSFSADRSVTPEMANKDHVAAYVRDLATRKNSRQATELTTCGAGLANATNQQRLTAVRLYYECESRVKAEQIEGCGQFAIAVNSQAFTGTNPRSILNPGFLHQPIEN